MAREFDISYAAVRAAVRSRFTPLQAAISVCIAPFLLLWVVSIGMYVTYGTREYELTLSGGIVVLLDSPPLPSVVAASGLIVRTEFNGFGFVAPYVQDSGPGFRAYGFPLMWVILPLGITLFALRQRSRRRLRWMSGGLGLPRE